MQLLHLDVLYRLIGGIDLEDSITLHEVKRLPPNRLGSLAHFFDVLGGIEFMFTLPGFWVPFVHWLWRIPTILAAAGVISREFEDGTWNTVRSTTLSVRDIVVYKYAAVLRYMEPHFLLVLYIRAMPVVVFGVSWAVSTLTVLPRQGIDYWFSTSLAFLFSGLYLLASPVLDVAFDAALGMLVSSFSSRRSTALIFAVLARTGGFVLPLALVIPLQSGLFNNLAQLDVIQLRAVAVVATFGPSYAFLWGINTWLSVVIVVLYAGIKLGLIRLMLAGAIRRAERVEVL
jgi:hypothetical protein